METKTPDAPMEQTQNRTNFDPHRRFRSFDGFIKKPKKSWSISSLKWFSLYSIGFVACIWAFIVGSGDVEWGIGFAVVIGITVIIVVPILFVENVRLTGKSHNGQPRIRPYINALIFIGLAIVSASAGWFAGTSVRKFIEIVTSSSMSP